MSVVALAVLQSAALALAALAVALRGGEVRAARRRATQLAAAVTGVSLLGLALATTVPAALAWQAPGTALVAVITLLALALSSLANSRPSTMATILALGALSTLSLWVEGSAAAGFLAAQTALMGTELRGTARDAWRPFLVFQVVALGLMGLSSAGVVSPWLFWLGLALRQGCWPLHSWLVRLTESAPTGLVVAYAAHQLPWLTLASGPLPDALAPWALASAGLAALLGTVQTDLKRCLAFPWASQSGLLAYAVSGSHPQGLVGGRSYWILVALATAAFAMSCEALQARRADTLSLGATGTDFEATPLLATSFMLSGLALAGLPGSLGFVAETLVVQEAASRTLWYVPALLLIMAINATTVMRCLLTLFVGPKPSGPRSDLSLSQHLALTVSLLALLLLGTAPQLLTRWFAG